MRIWLWPLVAAILNGCAPSAIPARAALIDEIEKNVRLPPDASPLSHYARAYAYAPNRRVRAVYFQPDEPYPEFCKMALEHEQEGAQVSLFCPPPKGMSAGERRWFDNYRFLPSAKDGGCSWITVELDLNTRTIQVRCNGA
ncbi:hypothetical protein [Sphingomonas sp. G-3-2-10]|uniref:hypothetical protein n=1 Tax=Sphingomonas sp. G-3-2-10 TaxID=2728838 RepID=UPI00146D9F91|nr:hypothetical protein [Sphingomonas sp. G-3-2-10]NML08267.1 hypothetical protein [Sphingomonas sp. G-3-2-10]